MADARAWEPANAVEAAMAAALRQGDSAELLGLLASAELVLPVTAAAARGDEPVAWSIVEIHGQRCLPVFTSPEAMLAGTGQREGHGRATMLRDLVAAWPDPAYVMLLNPQTPLQHVISPAELLRLASDPIADVLDRPGDGTTPASGTIVQKFLSDRQAIRVLERNEHLVSGYVVRLDQIAHLDTLDALVTGLRLPQLNPDIASDETVLCALRWLAVGAALYPVAGFVDGAEPAVQLYQVRALRLPHQAELVQVTAAEPDLLVAWYDADHRTWTLDPGVRASGSEPGGGDPDVGETHLTCS